MKKLYTTLAIAIAMLVAIPSQAQISWGVRAGANLVNMKMSGDVLGSKNKAGFYVGPTVKFTVPLVGLSFDASALYDQRTAKVTANVNGIEGEQQVKQQTIQIPINLRYSVGLGSSLSGYIFAGPQFGFNIGSKNKTWTDYKNNVYDWTLKSSNFSANVGIGAMVLSHLQLKVNYNIAFGKTGEVQVKDAATSAWGIITGKAKANAWQISAAYYF